MPQSSEKDSQKTQTDTWGVRQKDAENKTDIVKYFDGRVLRTDVFGRNLSAEQIYKRSERISAALHMITSHIKDIEPLRMSVRTLSLKLLSLSLFVRHSLRSETSQEVKDILGTVQELISLTRLLGISGHVSLQNTHALVEAIDDLGSLLSSAYRSSLSEDTVILGDDLVPASMPRTASTPRATSRRASRTQHRVAEKVNMDIDKVQPRTSRAERIMDILGAGDMMGIKDVVLNLPEYSEKMVQRELADLVEAGRVRKIGEKRWSRYSVVR